MTVKSKGKISEMFERQSGDLDESLLIDEIMELHPMIRYAFQIVSISIAYGVLYFIGVTL